jgi:hypothetical protein
LLILGLLVNLPVKQMNKLHNSKYRKLRGPVIALIVLVFALAAWQYNELKTQEARLIPPSLPAAQLKAVAPEITNGESITAIKGSPENLLSSVKSPKNELSSDTLSGQKVSEVCGLSKAEAKAFLASNGAAGVPAANHALVETISKFTRSEDLSEKTLGLYLMANLAGNEIMESERLNYPGCKDDPSCAFKPFDAAQQARPANAQPLINLALSNRDPNVYAAALYACSRVKVDACKSVSYRRWAELEPDNAAAWLMAASEANTRQDSVERAANLQRAATASSYNTRVPSLSTVLTATPILQQSPLAHSQMNVLLQQIFTNTGSEAMGGLARHCGFSEVMDDSRRQLCDVLANKLAEKDETSIAILIAARIGERVGWNAERVQVLKDEYAVMTRQISQDIVSDENRFSCDALTKVNTSVQKTLLMGERARTREYIKKSGKSVTELAKSYASLSSTSAQ